MGIEQWRSNFLALKVFSIVGWEKDRQMNRSLECLVMFFLKIFIWVLVMVCGLRVVVLGLSSCGAQAQKGKYAPAAHTYGMSWNRMWPASPALQGRFLTAGSPGKSPCYILTHSFRWCEFVQIFFEEWWLYLSLSHLGILSIEIPAHLLKRYLQNAAGSIAVANEKLTSKGILSHHVLSQPQHSKITKRWSVAKGYRLSRYLLMMLFVEKSV